jgi:ABC-type dipeptide/oligopeptide/nickel transport system permease subunit
MRRFWPLVFLPVLWLPELPLDPFQGGAPPDLHHWLGTDLLGRDALRRLLLAAARAGGFASACAMGALLLAWLLAGTGSRAQSVLSALRALPALLWLIPLAVLMGGLERTRLAPLVALLLAPHLEAPLRVKAEALRRGPAWAMGRVQGATRTRRLLAWAPWAAQEAALLFPSAWLGALWTETTLAALGLGTGPSSDSFGRLLAEELPDLALGSASAWAALLLVLGLAWSLSSPEPRHEPHR